MTPFVKRNLLIPVAAVLFVGLVYSLIYLIPVLRGQIEHLEIIAIAILIMLAIDVMLFWATLGPSGGLVSFLLSLRFIYRPLTDLNPYYYGILIMAFFINSFIGYHIYWKTNKASQQYTVTMEKVREDTNLIANHFENRIAEISAMEDKIESLLKLKSISDDLSLSLSTKDVIDVVAEKTFQKYSGDIRVVFYLAEPESKEISLFTSKKSSGRKPVIMKKGGIFERWVIKNMQSLLVRNVNKDFRFSVAGEEKEEDFVSLISKPLVREGRLLGIIRVDSPAEDAFEQHQLRILDIIGELAAIALENAKLYRRTEELAIKDSLTGLFVHRYFMERLEEEVRRALRSNNTFAFLMLDIDDFKEFNDKYGHMAGDIVLKNVSMILQRKASAGDIVCRYGGEEFAFVALNCDKKSAKKLAEEINNEIQNSFVNIRREKKTITVSIGISMFPEHSKTKDDLIWEADRQLYKAKSEGKNKVCLK